MFMMIVAGFVRTARRQPLYVALNIVGLAMGVGVFLVMALLVRNDYSFNRSLPDNALIVRVDEHYHFPGTTPSESADASFYALPFLRQDFPQIVSAARVEDDKTQLINGPDISSRRVINTDSSFLQTIPLPLLRGDAARALDTPDGLVISEEASRAIFGTVEVLGRRVTLNNDGDKQDHVITGVLAKPKGPVTINPELIAVTPQAARNTSCFQRWGSSCGNIYLRFRNDADRAAVAAHLRDFVMRRAAGTDQDDRSQGAHPERIYGLSLVSLRDIRFHDLTVDDSDSGVDRNVTDSLGLIGVLALVLGVVNAINLATARAGLRAREVAIRKTMGAASHQLLIQFTGEAMLLSLVASALGLAMCEIVLPVVASLTGQDIQANYRFILPMLALVTVLCGLASGVYPATVLSRFRPAFVLAAARTPAGGRGAVRLRNKLVLGQFVLAIGVAFCTLVVNRQAAFMRNGDHGFEKQGLLLGPQIHSKEVGVQYRMLDALRAVPGVTSVALGQLEPDAPSLHQFNVSPLLDAANNVQVLGDTVGSDYRQTYGVKLLAGRWFDAAHGQDDGPGDRSHATPGTYNVVINSRAVHVLGFASPQDAIGQVMKDEALQLHIIGVEADIRFLSPREAVRPQLTFYSTKALSAPIPAVRFSGVTATVMQDRLRKAWHTVLPDTGGDFKSADDLLGYFYQSDVHLGLLFLMGSAAAIGIAALGLYGLASFTASRRLHEIGIRKTLGATTWNVLALMLDGFLRPVLLACVIACPIAWLTMRGWLSGFDQRVVLSPFDFLLVVGVALIIAAGTVLGQTLRVARAAPSVALRQE